MPEGRVAELFRYERKSPRPLKAKASMSHLEAQTAENLPAVWETWI